MDKIRSFIRFADNMSEWTGRVVSFLILFAIFTLLYEIISRYIFHAPTLWAHEISHHFYGAHFMLGAAYALLHRAHVRTDVLVGRFSPRTQEIFAAIASVIFFLYVGLLLWNGTIMAWNSVLRNEYMTTTFRSPLWPVKLTIPIGATLLLIQGIANLVRNIYYAFTGTSIV